MDSYEVAPVGFLAEASLKMLIRESFLSWSFKVIS